MAHESRIAREENGFGMIRAVIFDFNGVLVDDEHLHFDMFREVLAVEGVTITDRDYHERYLGLDDRGCFEAALIDGGQQADQERLDALIARKAVRYAEEAGVGLRFFPGAADCLAALAGRWPLAINSGALRPEIEFALGLINSRERVGSIVSAEDTSRCKPDPQGYLLAAGRPARRPEGRGARPRGRPVPGDRRQPGRRGLGQRGGHVRRRRLQHVSGG